MEYTFSYSRAVNNLTWCDSMSKDESGNKVEEKFVIPLKAEKVMSKKVTTMKEGMSAKKSAIDCLPNFRVCSFTEKTNPATGGFLLSYFESYPADFLFSIVP